MLSPIQVGDSLIGQLCEAAVFVVDHVMPRVSKYWLHWETNDDDLGPIIPEFGSEVPKSPETTAKSTAAPPALVV